MKPRGLVERPWGVLKAERVLDDILLRVERADTFQTERWKFVVVPIVGHDRDRLPGRQRITSPSFRGHAKTFEQACEWAEKAAQAIIADRTKLGRDGIG